MCRYPFRGLRMSDEGEDANDQEPQITLQTIEIDSDDSTSGEEFNLNSSESEADSSGSDELFGDVVWRRRSTEDISEDVRGFIDFVAEHRNNNNNNENLGPNDSPASPDPEPQPVEHESPDAQVEPIHLTADEQEESTHCTFSASDSDSPSPAEDDETPPDQNEPLVDPYILRKLILGSLIPEPLVFKGINENWRPILKDIVHFGDLLEKDHGVYIECKEGLKRFESEMPQWESARRTKFLQWGQMLDWDKTNGASNNWIYYDYKEMKKVVHPEHLKDFDWGLLGFPERNGKDSSLWIGSAGSFTPCHYDTYGCNLVCQVKGRKKWILFPPKDTTYLNPTRVPYEESSVYSQINFCASPETLAGNQALQNCSPISVILEPGDVLYVPPKWWHFVQAEEFSISVNTWIELAEDDQSRMDEAIVRSIVGSSIAIAPPDRILEILNPNEVELLDITPHQIDVMLHNVCAKQIEAQGTRKRKTDSSNYDADEPPQKKARTTPSVPCFEDFLDRCCELVSKLSPYQFTPSESGGELEVIGNQNQVVPLQNELNSDQVQDPRISRSNGNHNQGPSQSQTYYSHLINAIGHPDVVEIIRKQFLLNIENAMKSGNPPAITNNDGTTVDSITYTHEMNGTSSSPSVE